MKCNKIPQTVNIHSLIPCNYSCKFCYAAFTGSKQKRLPQSDLHQIIKLLAEDMTYYPSDRRKINFAGGEPLLSKTITEDVKFAKELGFVTSVVTNGSLLKAETIDELAPYLDILTLSVDSLDHEANVRIGRVQGGKTLLFNHLLTLIDKIKSAGIHLKINTVVNRYNHSADFSDFIAKAYPIRWKVFQVLLVEGENDQGFRSLQISDDEFQSFVSRHEDLKRRNIKVISEHNELMRGSYAMIAPNGCFFDNSDGGYRYSREIIKVGAETAFNDIYFDSNKFKEREGNYSLLAGGLV